MPKGKKGNNSKAPKPVKKLAEDQDEQVADVQDEQVGEVKGVAPALPQPTNPLPLAKLLFAEAKCLAVEITTLQQGGIHLRPLTTMQDLQKRFKDLKQQGQVHWNTRYIGAGRYIEQTNESFLVALFLKGAVEEKVEEKDKNKWGQLLYESTSNASGSASPFHCETNGSVFIMKRMCFSHRAHADGDMMRVCARCKRHISCYTCDEDLWPYHAWICYPPSNVFYGLEE